MLYHWEPCTVCDTLPIDLTELSNASFRTLLEKCENVQAVLTYLLSHAC